MDFFIDNHIKNAISHLILHKDEIKDNTEIWKSLTRMMFMNYPAMQVWEWMQTALEEASDEEWFEKKYPKEIFEEVKLKNPIKIRAINSIIGNKLNIISVAENYGIEIKNNKCSCPFHDELEPSFTFYPLTNSFYCFGCHKGGDIIKFVKLMEENKNDDI